MREETSKLIPLVSKEEADAVIWIYSADQWPGPVEGKLNILFSMFESEDSIPRSYAVNIQKADVLLVPCYHCENVFRKYTDKPIYVVQEGTDLDLFTYKRRKFSLPLRFLYVGAPNPRKGTDEISIISQVLKDSKDIEIYIKTTVTDKIVKKGNVIFDSRKLTDQELVDLYHSAHCFLLPSRGEGFGLTLAEAMSTGLPCISPCHTGIKDYFDSYVGYVCKTHIKTVFLENYALYSQWHYPDINDIVGLMNHVLNNYDEAVQKGKLARKRIENFSWQKAGQRMAEVLKEIGNGLHLQ
jgi:glycosyltransferase involved in cell wall biosynthesis